MKHLGVFMRSFLKAPGCHSELDYQNRRKHPGCAAKSEKAFGNRGLAPLAASRRAVLDLAVPAAG